MTLEIGQHVRVDCTGPRHLQTTGRITHVQPVRLSDGAEHTVYVVEGDEPMQDKEHPQIIVGDGEIVEVLPE